jgi:hypothetical protein
MTGRSRAGNRVEDPNESAEWEAAKAPARDEAEGIDDRIARLRKEKELLELELELNLLRRRAAALPDRKTF